MHMDSQLCSAAPHPTSMLLSPRVTSGHGGGVSLGILAKAGGSALGRRFPGEAACGQAEGRRGRLGGWSPHTEARVTKHTELGERGGSRPVTEKLVQYQHMYNRHGRAPATCPQGSRQLPGSCFSSCCGPAQRCELPAEPLHSVSTHSCPSGARASTSHCHLQKAWSQVHQYINDKF